MPKLRKPRTSAKANKTRAVKPAGAAPAPAAALVVDAAETIDCMHCGHTNPLPGGRKPGKTVACKLCGRMFSVEAAAAHVPPPPPEPPPPPPGMTPHRPDSESVDAVNAKGPLIYTPALGPKKRASRAFKFTLGLTITVFVAACGIGLAVMVPTLNRTREAAKRAACAANLRRVGNALNVYTYANYGFFPDSLGRLVVSESLPADALLCPAGDETPAAGATPQAVAEQVNAGRHCSFTYLGRGMNKRTGAGSGITGVVAYEPLSHHGDGVQVLFADGHVAFVPLPQAKQLIADLQAGKNPPGVTGY